MTDLIVAFRNFANAPKNWMSIMQSKIRHVPDCNSVGNVSRIYDFFPSSLIHLAVKKGGGATSSANSILELELTEETRVSHS